MFIPFQINCFPRQSHETQKYVRIKHDNAIFDWHEFLKLRHWDRNGLSQQDEDVPRSVQRKNDQKELRN